MSELMPMMLLDAIIIEISVHPASRPGHLGALARAAFQYPAPYLRTPMYSVRLGEQRILGQQVHMPSRTLAMCHDMLLTPAICTPYVHTCWLPSLGSCGSETSGVCQTGPGLPSRLSPASPMTLLPPFGSETGARYSDCRQVIESERETVLGQTRHEPHIFVMTTPSSIRHIFGGVGRENVITTPGR